MDEHTLDKLEFTRITQLLSEHAQCALGRDLALHVRPSRRATQVTMWLDQGRQFAKWVAEHGLPPFGGIQDVREHVRRAVPPAKLEPEEFADLAATLEGVSFLRKYLRPPPSATTTPASSLRTATPPSAVAHPPPAAAQPPGAASAPDSLMPHAPDAGAMSAAGTDPGSTEQMVPETNAELAAQAGPEANDAAAQAAAVREGILAPAILAPVTLAPVTLAPAILAPVTEGILAPATAPEANPATANPAPTTPPPSAVPTVKPPAALRPSDGFELVTRLGERLGDFQVIADRIKEAIDPRGKVRDEASERLLRLRREIDEVRQNTREVFDRLLRQATIVKMLQYPNATFHADRMVLPLKAEQRGRIPGIVHRSSDSGQTLFVEPAEAVELNNARINLLQMEQEEVNRILWELTHLVHLNQKEILRTLETLAVLDLLTAKYKFARRYGLHLPEINTAHRLRLIRARNPILMTAFEEEAEKARTAAREAAKASAPAAGVEAEAGRPAAAGPWHPRAVVPIDVRLGDDFDVMMITGPNTGGKTAALKTVGMIALMAQSGLPIPAAAGSYLPIFEDVWIDVGDEQSLQQSLSTFSSHLARILQIIQRARRGTLVLCDELGAGTDPDEGAAIGRAVVERLIECGCLAMVTTHLGALKALGYEMDRVDNASVQFDIETLRPTFELRIGEPGNSNAIAIASRLGMPRKMVLAARKHLSSGPRALNRAIAGTLRARRDSERARVDAEKARQEAARETLAALDRARALEQQEAAYAAWVQRVCNLRPGEEVKVRNFDQPGRVVRTRIDKQTASVAIGTVEVEVQFNDLIFPE